jgi:tetratricopeptide (TPR) repeat protein
MTKDMMISADDLLKIGSSAIENGNYDIAIAAFNNVILRDLKCFEAHHIRGSIYKYYDNYGEAIRDFDRAIEMKPECAEAYYNRGCTYRKDVDDIQHAIRNFTKAIELRSDYAEAYNNRGDLHGDVGDYRQAIADFT